MEIIEFLLELCGGATLLFGIGYLLSHLLKVDKFSTDMHTSDVARLKRKDMDSDK